ncbi:MAG: 4Fe-4S binding protein [Candidatus Helarchaeota archaeon]
MEYYFPYLTNQTKCRGCKDCIGACPAHAIDYEEEFDVDKEKCKEYQNRIEDICMNCLEYCRKQVIRLTKGT